MLLLVTSRRFRSGKFEDEEERDFGYFYLPAYKNGPQGNDGFKIKSSWRNRPDE